MSSIQHHENQLSHLSDLGGNNPQPTDQQFQFQFLNMNMFSADQYFHLNRTFFTDFSISTTT
jgi:hypothetical protein